MSRQLLSAAHLRLLAVAEDTVLVRLQGPGQYGVQHLPALRPHPLAGEQA
ncbi:hypothetical protein ACFXKF_32510 [Streptomyces scopuliridis]